MRLRDGGLESLTIFLCSIPYFNGVVDIFSLITILKEILAAIPERRGDIMLCQSEGFNVEKQSQSCINCARH